MDWFDIIKLEDITKAKPLTAEDEQKIKDLMRFRNMTREEAEKSVRRQAGKMVTDTKRSLSDRVRGVLNPSGKNRSDSFARARQNAAEESSRLRPKTPNPDTRLRPKTPNPDTRLRPKNQRTTRLRPKNQRPKTPKTRLNTKPEDNVPPAPDLAALAEEKRKRKLSELTDDLEFQAQ